MNGRSKKMPEEVSVKRAANGGFIVRHSYNNSGSGESYQPPEEHAFGNHAAAHKHVSGMLKAMGNPNSDQYGGGTHGAGASPQVTKAPNAGVTRPTGVAGKAKAAPPNRRTRGAGVD